MVAVCVLKTLCPTHLTDAVRRCVRGRVSCGGEGWLGSISTEEVSFLSPRDRTKDLRPNLYSTPFKLRKARICYIPAGRGTSARSSASWKRFFGRPPSPRGEEWIVRLFCGFQNRDHLYLVPRQSRVPLFHCLGYGTRY